MNDGSLSESSQGTLGELSQEVVSQLSETVVSLASLNGDYTNQLSLLGAYHVKIGGVENLKILQETYLQVLECFETLHIH